MILCKCGCGKEVTKERNRFINGHNKPMTGRHHKEESKQKTSSKLIGRNLSQTHKENIVISMNKLEVKKKIRKTKDDPKVKENLLKSLRESWKNEQRKSSLRNRMINGGATYAASFPRNFEKEERRKEKLRREMKNGKAIYMNRCIKNPSWPQVRTYNNTKELYSDTEINYPLHLSGRKWYSLDITIPSLKIDIEYDGKHWHQDQEKDRKRDEELKSLGWKVLRYRDHVPSKEQLKEDILKFVKG